MTIPHGYTRVSEILAFFKVFKVLSTEFFQSLDNEQREIIQRMGYFDVGILERKARIGTNVHQAISDFFDDLPLQLSEKEKGYFESFKKWNSLYHMDPIHKETRYFNHSEMITGQCDCIMNWKGSPLPILVDFKTSYEVDEKTWPLQGAFYCWLAKLPIGTEIHFIQLKADGSYAFPFQFIYTDELELMRLSAMRIYKYFNPV